MIFFGSRCLSGKINLFSFWFRFFVGYCFLFSKDFGFSFFEISGFFGFFGFSDFVFLSILLFCFLRIFGCFPLSDTKVQRNYKYCLLFSLNCRIFSNEREDFDVFGGLPSFQKRGYIMMPGAII